MFAYSHPIVTREAFLAELQAHADADQIVQGQYWDNERGCAVGCSLHSISRLIPDARVAMNDHYKLAETIGAPPPLLYLEDKIFEGLPVNLARQWPMRFSSAIQQNADLSNVWPQFAAWMLREIVLPSAEGYPGCGAAIERVARGYETSWQSDTADAAAYAATYAAAYAATYAARAAADAADTAAYAARAVESAAADAAYAAVYAADAAYPPYTTDAARAARAAAYTKMADKIIALLAAAPIGEAGK